jgi:nucleoside-diphosphate kinase
MKKTTLQFEKTLIILKPDAIKRGLIGKIFEVFEVAGLNLMAANMVKPNQEVIKKHYPGTKEWLIEMGKKTQFSFANAQLKIEEEMGTNDPYKLGSFVYERLINYWQEGPIIVSVWQGPNAIQVARKLRGHTIPTLAQPGTILGQYSYDSSVLSSSLNRVVKTFIHASGNIKEAEREIAYWFPNTEFKNYPRDLDSLYLE